MKNELRGRSMDCLQYDLFGELYASDSTRVGKYSFPLLKKTSTIPTGTVKPFNYLLSTSNPEETWFHCFCDDYQFSRLWTSFDHYLPVIKKTQGFITTDFSLYRDYTYDALIWNCYKNRVMAYALQKANINIIPTAGFGPEKTWSWCFDGIAKHSVVAITTNGTLSDAEARRIFVGGVEALVYTVEPSAIVVCGKTPSWMESKYSQIPIIHIPSFSQSWKDRRCA